MEKLSKEAEKIMMERFGKDSIISLATACDNIICNDIDYDDTDFALECTINVAHEADYWLKELNIKHNMEPGTGADREIFDKIQLLQKWLNKC